MLLVAEGRACASPAAEGDILRRDADAHRVMGKKVFSLQLSPPAAGSVLPPLPAPSRRLACTRRERKDISQRLAGAVFDPSPRLAGCAFHGGREILSPKTVVFHLLIFPKGLFCHFFDRLNSAKRRSSCDIVAKPCANAKCSRKATNLVRRQSSLVGCTGRTAAAYAQISPLGLRVCFP